MNHALCEAERGAAEVLQQRPPVVGPAADRAQALDLEAALEQEARMVRETALSMLLGA